MQRLEFDLKNERRIKPHINDNYNGVMYTFTKKNWTCTFCIITLKPVNVETGNLHY